MSLFRKFFYRKPPDGLLEISERVYVFDCCYTTDIWEDDEYRVYIGGIVRQLGEHFPDGSFMVFNFREGEYQSLIASILSEYDMTIMDYPRHYEGCPLLTMEVIHHFLRSSESWLSLGHQNVLLLHCERGGWPILAFMLAALLIYRKQFTGELKTLDMIYKQAPLELLQLMSALNPLPSQLRYLQYVSRRNVGSEWPPLDRALTLDCIILRDIPDLGGEGGCRPIFRIYGQDPFMAADRTPKVLFSTPKRSNLVRLYKQADCELIKIDIHCHIQGDVVMECITLDSDLDREEMMFRVMFNTAFVRSNILMLNRDEIDTLWSAKDQFPTDFRAEVLFSEMDSGSYRASVDFPCLEEKGGLPVEAFAKVQEIFSNVDWLDTKTDVARNVLQHITALQENLDIASPQITDIDSMLMESTVLKVQEDPKKKESFKKISGLASISLEEEPVVCSKSSPNANKTINKADTQQEKGGSQTTSPAKQSPGANLTSEKVELQKLRINVQLPSPTSPNGDSIRKKVDPQELHIAVQRPAQSKIISPRVSPMSVSSPVYGNSLQVSPVALSKYSSAPFPLGITALLQDDAVLKGEEIVRSVTLNLPSSPVSSPGKDVCKAVHLSHVRNINSASPPPLSPSSLQSSTQTPQSSKASQSSFDQFPESLPKRIQVPSDPPPPPPLSSRSMKSSSSSPSPPPPPPSFSGTTSSPLENTPPPSPVFGASQSATVKNLNSIPPPPPPPSGSTSLVASEVSSPQPPESSRSMSGPPPPPPPPPNTAGPSPPLPRPLYPGSASGPVSTSSAPPPPSPPSSVSNSTSSNSSPHVPPVPPPPANGASAQPNSAVSNGNVPPVPGPPAGGPFSARGRGLLRASTKCQAQTRKANLKPYHWLKLTRAMQGSLWAEAQKSDEASRAPEFDMSELESLFSAAAPKSDAGGNGGKSGRRTTGTKPEKVQLIELRRAYNCEIMLSKVKIPLPELTSSILALDDSALDVDQVDNLIKFCPTKEEMELLKNYAGDKEKLGKCEQFFLELMKVPRVESKLRVFSFRMQFDSQVSDLRHNLNVVNSAAEEIRNSVKLKKIMQTILSLGNALNHGTARGSAIGFRLDSLLKLTDTRARNNKMTLMHYLCKVLAEKLPELLDFPKDLGSLEAATKVQLKYLAEEMQAISKGLEKVVQELTASENDGPVSESFCKTLKAFLSSAEGEVRSLASLYSNVGRNADALALYFGEDPARCPFEQVVSTLLNFVRMFVRAHDENLKQIELEKKKAAKDTEIEKLKRTASRKGSHENLLLSPISSGN